MDNINGRKTCWDFDGKVNKSMYVTDMELEDSSGAHRMALPMQLHVFRLSVLQGIAAQEVDTVREAQLPALGVGFKVHHQGLMGVERGRSMKRDGGFQETEMSGHTQREHLQSPPGSEHI